MARNDPIIRLSQQVQLTRLLKAERMLHFADARVMHSKKLSRTTPVAEPCGPLPYNNHKRSIKPQPHSLDYTRQPRRNPVGVQLVRGYERNHFK